jgi:hypothetical protein
MTDETGTPEPLSVGLITQLEKRGIFPECPSCRNDDWWLFDEPGKGQDMAIINASYRIPVHTLACTKCGLIQRYATDVAYENLPPPRKENC